MDDISEAIQRALDELGLDESFSWAVRDLMQKREETWPDCCGGGCDPCVLTSQRAARRAKELLTQS